MSVHNVRFTHKYIIFKGIREFVSTGLRYARFENNHLQKQNLDFHPPVGGSQASNSNIMNQTHDIMERHYLMIARRVLFCCSIITYRSKFNLIHFNFNTTLQK